MCEHGDVTECSPHELIGKFTLWGSCGPFLASSPQRPCSLPTQTARPTLGWDLDFWEWGLATTLDADVRMLIPGVKALIHPVHIVP